MLKRILGIFGSLLFPPKCVGCGRFLQTDILSGSDNVFCPQCDRRWRSSRLEHCGRCGLEYARCRCMPRLLRNLGIESAVKLISYEKVRETVGKKSILAMKKQNKTRVFAFFGGELARALEGYLEETGRKESKLLVTYLPRARRGVREWGFDQSKKLAKRVAQSLSCDFAPLFKRKRKWLQKEQKHLSFEARQKNAQSAFLLARGAAQRVEACETLVIVDDVITTGASLSGCISCLDKEQRGRVVCLSVGMTPLLKKREK